MDLTEWRHLLAADGEYGLSPGVTADDLAGAEADLGVEFPAALRQVYLASDGVFSRDGQYYPVWPLAEVLRRNRADWSRDDWQGRADLVGFGDNGTGAPFCVERAGSDSVYHWDPIDGGANPLARTFTEFWAGWNGWNGWNAGTITT